MSTEQNQYVINKTLLTMFQKAYKVDPRWSMNSVVTELLKHYTRVSKYSSVINEDSWKLLRERMFEDGQMAFMIFGYQSDEFENAHEHVELCIKDLLFLDYCNLT